MIKQFYMAHTRNINWYYQYIFRDLPGLFGRALEVKTFIIGKNFT